MAPVTTGTASDAAAAMPTASRLDPVTQLRDGQAIQRVGAEGLTVVTVRCLAGAAGATAAAVAVLAALTARATIGVVRVGVRVVGHFQAPSAAGPMPAFTSITRPAELHYTAPHPVTAIRRRAPGKDRPPPIAAQSARGSHQGPPQSHHGRPACEPMNRPAPPGIGRTRSRLHRPP